MIRLGPDSAPLDPGTSVVTIGVYDGVHLGHRLTLGNVVSEARSSGRRSVVATFDQHPLLVVRPELAPRFLCTLEQKLELLETIGIDAVAVIPFDAERAAETPDEFVRSVLVGKLAAGRIVVGEDFRFGRERLGDVDFLRSEGGFLGFDVLGVTLDREDGEPISSTRIRALVAEGDVTEASRLLGRVHELCGPVLHGDGRGGPELGYPTANIHVPETMAIPGVGIYAGWYRDDHHDAIPAAISVGRRPTFYEGADPLIEAHLIGFNGDLYGAAGRISFLARLRDEQRFESVADLITQMSLDVAEAERLCALHAGQAPA